HEGWRRAGDSPFKPALTKTPMSKQTRKPPQPAVQPLPASGPDAANIIMPLGLMPKLEQLQQSHPEHADILREAWSKVRNRERPSPEFKEKTVVRKLREGCTTVAELVEETDWKKPEVMTTLLHLVDAGVVEERKVKDDKCNSGRGGTTIY